jgi:hypothetical protein
MEPIVPETRDKVTHWVQDGLKLFPHLPALLHGDEASGARAADLERECDRLRKESGDLRRELDEIRREHDRLRAERDEVTQAFTKLMDTVQPMNQIAQKLGVRKSPFDRSGPSAPAAAPAAPAPKPS